MDDEDCRMTLRATSWFDNVLIALCSEAGRANVEPAEETPTGRISAGEVKAARRRIAIRAHLARSTTIEVKRL
jgi:hypothetical protein